LFCGFGSQVSFLRLLTGSSLLPTMPLARVAAWCTGIFDNIS
jgi:hypothetical protein